MTESETLYSKIQKRLIYISFLLAILIDFIPLSGSLFHWLPEFTALMLMYWIINRPQNLLMDIGTNASLGGHALAYVIAAYIVIQNRRQIVLYHYGVQAVVIFAALLCSEMILTVVRWRYTHHFYGWTVFLSPVVGALLWPLLNKIMVSLLNFLNSRR